MTLRAIHGKPGSGKSCYCVSLLTKQLADWARYDYEHEDVYSRVLYTNIPLNIDAINEYLKKELGFAVDVSEHIELLDDTFFKTAAGDYREWWDDFSEGALIVIDEVHHYLPASVRKKKGGVDYADKFTNYVSMHRHRQHDIILLSQHIDNVSVEVKKQIDTVYEVLNVKNRTIGVFPFTVQMADVDAVREAWGFPVQMAHIKRGICEARKVIYDKAYEVFILSPTLFGLYRSHTKSDEALDRPSLKLGKLGSVVWFARRYVFKFTVSICLLVTAVLMARSMFTEMPKAIVDGLTSGIKIDGQDKPPLTPPMPAAPFAPMGGGDSPAALTPAVADNHSDPMPVPDDVVSGFIKNGVITPKGILRMGDTMRFGGGEETIKRINFYESKIEFESGKKYQR